MRLAGDDEDAYTGTITWCSTPYEANTGIRIEDDLINQGGEKDMVGLYEVTVVNTKTNEFILKHTVVAKDATRAQMKTVRRQDIDITNDDIKFFVRMVCEWESKKPKEVKVVKEG